MEVLPVCPEAKAEPDEGSQDEQRLQAEDDRQQRPEAEVRAVGDVAVPLDEDLERQTDERAGRGECK